MVQSFFQGLGLVVALLLEILSSVQHCFLKIFKLSVKFIAKLVNFILALSAILPDLPSMDLFSKHGLPLSDVRLQNSYFFHQGLEFYICLNLQAVISHKLESFLNKGEDLYLLISTEASIAILIKHSHELFD